MEKTGVIEILPKWGWVAHSDGMKAATLVTTQEQGGAGINDGATGAR